MGDSREERHSVQQTLLRLHPDEWLTAGWADGAARAGVWVPMLVWLAYTGWALWTAVRAEGRFGPDARAQAWVCGGGLALLASLPLWFGRVAPGLAETGIPVFGYGVCVFLGFAFGAVTTVRRARTIGLPAEYLWDLCLWLFVAGIGGARVNFLIKHRDEVFRDVDGLGEWFTAVVNISDGGLVLLGGVLACAAAFIVFCRRRGLPVLPVADLILPGFFVGLMFGRIGCLMNGCCFGDACDLPWAIRFPEGSVPYRALVNAGFLAGTEPATFPLHPTQVYSAVNAAVLAVLTAAYYHRRPTDGSVLALALLTYPVTRFALELLRGDELGFRTDGLTQAQTVGSLLFFSGVALTAWLAWRAGARAGEGTWNFAERGGV